MDIIKPGNSFYNLSLHENSVFCTPLFAERHAFIFYFFQYISIVIQHINIRSCTAAGIGCHFQAVRELNHLSVHQSRCLAVLHQLNADFLIVVVLRCIKLYIGGIFCLCTGLFGFRFFFRLFDGLLCFRIRFRVRCRIELSTLPSPPLLM